MTASTSVASVRAGRMHAGTHMLKRVESLVMPRYQCSSSWVEALWSSAAGIRILAISLYLSPSMSTASVNKWSAVKGQSGLDRCHARSGIAHCGIHARDMRDWGNAHVVAAARLATDGRRIQRPLRALAAVAADPPLSAAPVSLCLGLTTLPSEWPSWAAPGAERRVLKSDDEWRSSRLGTWRRRDDRGTTSAKLSDPPSLSCY